MPENSLNFEENVKNSFFKVKSDINSLNNEIKQIKIDLNEIKKDFLSLKEEITGFFKELNEKQAKSGDKNFLISSGNDRVINNQQSTINGNQHTINTFKQLTNREFSVFLAIYQLEEEIGKVTYSSIANKLGVSEVTARYYTNAILNKGLPIEKITHYNNKIYLSISKDFRDLKLINTLINARDSNLQTTLNKF